MTLLWLLQECYSLASSFFKVRISRRFTVVWNIRARHRSKKVPSDRKETVNHLQRQHATVCLWVSCEDKKAVWVRLCFCLGFFFFVVAVCG